MKNIEHQVKSKWYYIFWGIMALAVVSGQVYVGIGYREMTKATKTTEVAVSCQFPYEIPYSKKNKTGEFE